MASKTETEMISKAREAMTQATKLLESGSDEIFLLKDKGGKAGRTLSRALIEVGRANGILEMIKTD